MADLRDVAKVDRASMTEDDDSYGPAGCMVASRLAPCCCANRVTRGGAGAPRVGLGRRFWDRAPRASEIRAQRCRLDRAPAGLNRRGRGLRASLPRILPRFERSILWWAHAHEGYHGRSRSCVLHQFASCLESL